MLCLDSEKIEEFIELTTPNQYLAPHLVQTGFTTPLVRCVQALGETAPYRCNAKNTLITSCTASCTSLAIALILPQSRFFFFFFKSSTFGKMLEIQTFIEKLS